MGRILLGTSSTVWFIAPCKGLMQAPSVAGVLGLCAYCSAPCHQHIPGGDWCQQVRGQQRVKLVQTFLESIWSYLSRPKKCAHTFLTQKFIWNFILYPRDTYTPSHIVILWVLLTSFLSMSQLWLLWFLLEPGTVACLGIVMMGSHLVLKVLRRVGSMCGHSTNSGFYNSDSLVNTAPGELWGLAGLSTSQPLSRHLSSGDAHSCPWRQCGLNPF